MLVTQWLFEVMAFSVSTFYALNVYSSLLAFVPYL